MTAGQAIAVLLARSDSLHLARDAGVTLATARRTWHDQLLTATGHGSSDEQALEMLLEHTAGWSEFEPEPIALVDDPNALAVVRGY